MSSKPITTVDNSEKDVTASHEAITGAHEALTSAQKEAKRLRRRGAGTSDFKERKSAVKNGTKIKEKVFSKEIVKNGGNASKAARVVYPNQSDQSVGVTASRMLKRPSVRELILKEFEKQSLGMNDVIDIHKRNMLQDNNLNVSQRAVDKYYELSGATESKRSNVNIQFIVD